MIEFADASLQGNISQALIAESNAVARLEVLFNLYVKLIKEQRVIPRILFSLISSDKNIAHDKIKSRLRVIMYIGCFFSLLCE